MHAYKLAINSYNYIIVTCVYRKFVDFRGWIIFVGYQNHENQAREIVVWPDINYENKLTTRIFLSQHFL